MKHQRMLIGLLAALLMAPSWAATYTPSEGTPGYAAASGGTATATLPGGDLTGKLLIAIAKSTTGTATVSGSTNPTNQGYTRVDTLAQGGAMYAKIGTGSESNPAIAFSSGGAGITVTAWTSSTGWPVIGSVVAGTSENEAPGAATTLHMPAHTQITAGNLLIRMAGKGGNTTGITITSVSAASGFTAGALLGRSNNAGGMVLGSEYRTIAGDESSAEVAINTWSASASTRFGFAIELIPDDPAPTVSYDAATYDLGNTVVATLTDWTTTPTSFVNQSTGNDAYATTGTCNTSTCSGVLPDLADLVSGGAGEHTQLEVALTVRTQSGSENADDTFTINAPGTGDFIASVACASASCPADSVLKLNFGDAVVGDDLYCYSPFGGATVTDYGVPSWTTTPAQLKCRLFDESANAWTAETTDDFTEETEATCAQIVRDAWRATIRDLAREPICRSTFQ